MNNSFAFLDHIITQLYILMHKTQSDNYDYDRFSFDGIDRSGQFELPRHKSFFYFFLEHYEDFYRAYLLFEDEMSQKLYLDLILFRLLGHLHVKLPANNDQLRQFVEAAKGLNSNPSTLNFRSKFGELRHYEAINFDGKRLTMDGLWGNIAWGFMLKQYYYCKNKMVIEPTEGNYVIDGGAYIGENTLAFATTVGPQGKVYSFEPLISNLCVLKQNVSQNGLDNIVKIIPVGLGDVVDLKPLSASSETELNPGFSLRSAENADRVPIITIDSLVQNKEISGVDFIKMDIEGFELKALNGAIGTLHRFRPKLAISLYHKPEDLFEIPLFLHGLKLGYKFALEHYTIHQEETVLYAVA